MANGTSSNVVNDSARQKAYDIRQAIDYNNFSWQEVTINLQWALEKKFALCVTDLEDSSSFSSFTGISMKY